jgi:GMP synthase (glutamine-hydrolysing)
MTWNLGGEVAKCDRREYGHAMLQLTRIGSENPATDALFESLGDEMQVC